MREALNPAWKDDLPYVVAIVELAEGPHLMSNVVGLPVEDVHVGLPLQVCFEPIDQDFVLPKFRPQVPGGE